MINFSLFCFRNHCIGDCVTEKWMRRVCKIFRLLSCVSSKPVELDDGSIMINVRNNKNYHCRCRMVVRSLDGGESLPVEQLVFDHTLEDPAVAAGALEKEGVLYFTNPANTNSSEHDDMRNDISVSPSWSWSMCDSSFMLVNVTISYFKCGVVFLRSEPHPSLVSESR